MNLPSLQTLINACQGLKVSVDGGALLNALRAEFPGQAVRQVLTRGGWHRLGGVVDGKGNRIAAHIVQWAEDEIGDDMEAFVAKYRNADLYITRLAGRTHYLVVPFGEEPQDFVQLEVEELHEEMERRLLEPGYNPEDLEELLDPMEYEHLVPRSVGAPYYLFRRIFRIPELLNGSSREAERLRRFCADWRESSAARHPFCEHWGMSIRETQNRFGEMTVNAKPFPTRPAPPLPADFAERAGMPLANMLGEFDRAAGYPFAWYFYLVAVPATPDRLAELVYHDHQGEFDYLPSKDLAILREWIAKPYSL